MSSILDVIFLEWFCSVIQRSERSESRNKQWRRGGKARTILRTWSQHKIVLLLHITCFFQTYFEVPVWDYLLCFFLKKVSHSLGGYVHWATMSALALIIVPSRRDRWKFGEIDYLCLKESFVTFYNIPLQNTTKTCVVFYWAR